MKSTMVRNTIMLIGIITFCMLSLLSMLIYFDIQKRYCDLRDSSVHLIVSDVVTVIEKGLNIGLRCEEIQNVPSILHKQSQVASFIQGISVYNKKGFLLYTTIQKADSFLPQLLLAQFQADSLHKSIQTRAHRVGKLYVPVINSIGLTDVIVSLQYERFNESEFTSLKLFFVFIVLFLLTAITLASIIPIIMIFGPVSKSLLSFSSSESEMVIYEFPENQSLSEAKKEIEYLISDIEATAAIAETPEYA